MSETYDWGNWEQLAFPLDGMEIPTVQSTSPAPLLQCNSAEQHQDRKAELHHE